MFRGLLFIAILLVGLIAGLLLDGLSFQPDAVLDPTLAGYATQMQYTATPSATMAFSSGSALLETESPNLSGTVFYTSRIGGWDQVFAFIPGTNHPVLLLDGAFDNLDPILSPDGGTLAFVSDRGGSYDLYLLDLLDGSIRQLTNTREYEGHPTWSPDGLWIAFEAHYLGDYDIWILPVDGSQSPIMLTDNEGIDTSPAWDPNGRKIAFVSDREGSLDIFIADLDRPTDRFINMTGTEGVDEVDPSFSPNGSELAYSALLDGLDVVYVADVEAPQGEARIIGQGRGAAWSPDGSLIVANVISPQQTQLMIYSLSTRVYSNSGLPFVDGVEDLSWSAHVLEDEITALSRPEVAAPLYTSHVNPSEPDGGRLNLVDLTGIDAPHPSLSDAADEAFQALRERTIQVTGWDFLGRLDNAFVGINEPLPPGYAYNDWLYTGRAFAFAAAAVESGWVEVVPEEYGAQVYWRIYVRAANQDGTLGVPLREHPWDFNSRYADDPYAYDRGGTYQVNIPSGYYIDFTQLALDYGFERMPALSNWRTFFPGARFNEFVLRDDLNWEEAMLQLYPQAAIITPTPYRTPTPTPTRTPRPTPTPWWLRWRTPTPSMTPVLPPPATETPSP